MLSLMASWGMRRYFHGLAGATQITITDPYVRLFYQARNLMELLETVAAQKSDEGEVAVHLLTAADEYNREQQEEYFTQMQLASAPIGIHFTWAYDEDGLIHARHIVTDHGWKILLDRGLDVFQRYEMNDQFAFANRLQRYRTVKAFEVTFLWDDEGSGEEKSICCIKKGKRPNASVSIGPLPFSRTLALSCWLLHDNRYI